jgi:hypothetical protein
MNEITVANPFRTEDREERHTPVLASIAGQREMAEVQGAIVMARRFPRNPADAMDRLLNACTRKGLAEVALYSYSRGGQEVTGPSIRLAEAAAQAWGNLQWCIRELEQTEGESTVEAVCWDLESNARQSRVFHVPHVRHTRSGSTRLTDPRDIYELTANLGARRLRACILGVIPGDVIEAAVQQCEETLRASADTSPEALKRIVTAFGEFGVTQKQIETRCQCHLAAIRPAQVVQLRKIFASLKDGMSQPGDWFMSEAEAEARPQGNAGLKEVVARRRRKSDDENAGPKPNVEPQPLGDGQGPATTATDARSSAAPAPSVAPASPDASDGALTDDGIIPDDPQALKDRLIASHIIAHIQTITDAASLRLYNNTGAVRAPRERWRSEDPPNPLADVVAKAFTERFEKLTAGGNHD